LVPGTIHLGAGHDPSWCRAQSILVPGTIHLGAGHYPSWCRAQSILVPGDFVEEVIISKHFQFVIRATVEKFGKNAA
jgi:hypothetical protein